MRSSLIVNVLGLVLPSWSASLTQVSNFGDNPGSNEMYIYVPDNLAANPAIIVAVGHPAQRFKPVG